MPRIKTTRTVTVALLLLRVYLFGMLFLILAKFVMDSTRLHKPADSGAVSSKTSEPPAKDQRDLPR
jgi:hypothetical protein